MPRIRIPEMKRVPEGATPEMRQQMFEEYCQELRRQNPGRFNADGSLKTIWQYIRDSLLGRERP